MFVKYHCDTHNKRAIYKTVVTAFEVVSERGEGLSLLLIASEHQRNNYGKEKIDI